MLADIKCVLMGHKYILAQRLAPQSRRITCSRCSKSFAMNDDAQSIVQWDASFHRMYERHGVKIVYMDGEFGRYRTAIDPLQKLNGE